MARWLAIVTMAVIGLPGAGSAQSLGTFRWQTQPFCNVITVTVTVSGSVYRLEGTDDGCGGTAASVLGMAFPRADGTVGVGLTVVGPGAAALHLDSTINPAGGFNGTWRDSVGRNGLWAFTPLGGSGGAVRPVVGPVLPYGSSFIQPAGAADRGVTATVNTDTGSTGDAAAVFGQFGAASGFTAPGSAGIRGDSAEVIGVMGTTNSGWGVAGGASTDGIAVQGYAEGTNSVGVKAAHASGGVALEINNGAFRVTGPTRAAFPVGFNGPGCAEIDNPLLNGDPFALVFVTQRFGGNYNLYPSYDFNLNTWRICGTNTYNGQEASVLVIKQ